MGVCAEKHALFAEKHALFGNSFEDLGVLSGAALLSSGAFGASFKWCSNGLACLYGGTTLFAHPNNSLSLCRHCQPCCLLSTQCVAVCSSALFPHSVLQCVAVPSFYTVCCSVLFPHPNNTFSWSWSPENVNTRVHKHAHARTRARTRTRTHTNICTHTHTHTHTRTHTHT